MRTLQLEMEYAYGSLEDEARDVVGDSKGDLKLALSRRGSSDEVALLAAGGTAAPARRAGLAGRAALPSWHAAAVGTRQHAAGTGCVKRGSQKH